MTGRSMFGKSFGSCCDTVDSIFTHTAAAHNYKITRINCFLIRWFSFNQRRHNAKGCNINQAFSHIAWMKHYLTKWRWYPAFISTIPHAFNNAIKQTPRVQMGPQLALIIPVPHTKTITAHDQFCALTGSHGISIDSHNTGNCSAISFHI